MITQEDVPVALTSDLPDLVTVEVGTVSPERFLALVSTDSADELRRGLHLAHEAFDGRVIWNVNSTATGGGVAEMLQSLVPYARGAGVDARWLVIQGEEEFFRITKRIHNRLHGAEGDGGPLGDAERDRYGEVLRVNAERLLQRVNPGDIALLHDPQTAGLIPPLRARGLPVVWRCHVGVLDPNHYVREAWDFLRPFVRHADAYVFSTHGFVWDGLDPSRLAIIAPSIDPFSPKNEEIGRELGAAILHAAGITIGDSSGQEPSFQRSDGSRAHVSHRSEVAEEAPLSPDTQLVAQISRWDRLKDPEGVMQGFVDHVAPHTDAHLMLAGPSVAHVADDPEGLQVSQSIHAAWRALPARSRQRIHLVTLQMQDVEENAVTVNALQRRADVVVQKSLAEGFGLTVAEAMWKARPVVASRVGGIQDQIEDGVTGSLIDPRDLSGFGDCVTRLLQDPAAAHAMGHAAQERVRNRFLGSRHLLQYLELLSGLLNH
ncbi:MAG: glycosyltransferase [Candidatus Dormibacteraeota bacterium]|nr:glycosyltransferase [Candidatus Dormibacteraeota bacterium]